MAFVMAPRGPSRSYQLNGEKHTDGQSASADLCGPVWTWLDDVQPEGPEIGTMIAELSHRRIPVDPTLIAYATKIKGSDPRFVDSPDLALAPAAMRSSFSILNPVRDWTTHDFEHGRRSWHKMDALVQAYSRGGVLLTAGSDEPNPWVVPGPSLHPEPALLVEAGLSPPRNPERCWNRECGQKGRPDRYRSGSDK